MAKSKTFAQNAFSINLRALLDQREWSEHRLASKSGVAQKTINNILNRESSPTIETIERLANAFGLLGWQLMLPNIPVDVIGNHSLGDILDYYSKASTAGKEYIKRIAEKEAGYGT